MANTPASQTNPSKMTWLIIWAALTGSVFIYGLIGYFVTMNRTPVTSSTLPMMQMILGALGVVKLIAAVFWLQFKTKVPPAQVIGTNHEPMMPPGEFQTQSIVALALAEACALYGLVLLFMGAPITTYALFAAGALVVSVGFILPRGMAYWTAYEAQQKAEKEPSPFSS